MMLVLLNFPTEMGKPSKPYGGGQGAGAQNWFKKEPFIFPLW